MMKSFFKKITIQAVRCLLATFVIARLQAQTVVGGTTSHPSAEFEIQSSNRGFLPPRLTLSERNAIAAPATGLIVFNTTLNCIEMNVGAPATPIWVCLSTAAGVTTYGGSGCTGVGTIQGAMHPGEPVNGVTMTLYANVSWPGFWSLTAANNGVTFSGSGNFVSPGCQMITLTAAGTPISAGTFSWTTSSQPAGSAEGIVNCTISPASSSAVVAINTALTPVTHTTTGATGIGTATGLPPGVTASWTENTITISGTPTAAGIYNYSIPLTGGCGSGSAMGTITVTIWGCGAYVASGVWKAFKCHNLGADESADPFTPSWRLIGDYYQWGRKSVAAFGPTGSSSGEANAGAVVGWDATAAPNGAWTDGSKTANDPCPAGFRVPTKAQWDAVLYSSLNSSRSYLGSWGGSSTNYSSGLRIGSGVSGLFLPTAGNRDPGASGALFSRGSDGNYWSSTENGSNAWCPNFNIGNANAYGINRAFGISVRCIAE